MADAAAAAPAVSATGVRVDGRAVDELRGHFSARQHVCMHAAAAAQRQSAVTWYIMVVASTLVPCKQGAQFVLSSAEAVAGTLTRSSGSAFVELGTTQVAVAVHGPKQVEGPAGALADEGRCSCPLSSIPSATCKASSANASPFFSMHGNLAAALLSQQALNLASAAEYRWTLSLLHSQGALRSHKECVLTLSHSA